jgi:hypothetical protein
MMLTLHRTLLAAGVAVTVLVTACATGPTELTVDPAAAPAGTVEPTEPPAGPTEDQRDEPVDDPVHDPVHDPVVDPVHDPVDEATDGAVAEPRVDGAPAPNRESTTRNPPGRVPTLGTTGDPAPSEGSGIVVDEDGCAVDVATGLVITCADPAAGPDEGTAEFCAIDPAHVSCTER